MNKKAYKRALDILDAHYKYSFPAELQSEIRGWFMDSSNRDEKYSALEKIYDKYVFYNQNPSKEAYESLEEIRTRLGFPPISSGTRVYTIHRPKHSFWGVFGKVAAVLMPVFIIAGVAWFFADSYRGSEPDYVKTAIQTSVSTPGSTKHIVLADGTEVWLRNGSELTYPEEFGKSREVNLVGEAYFDVVRDSKKPFKVNTRYIDVEVLGTRFNVYAVPGDKITSVKLDEGVVKAIVNNNSYDMTPGQSLSYNAVSSEIVLSRTGAGDLAGWMSDELVFENTTLAEIFRATERHFGVRIEFNEDDMSSLRHSTRFPADASLSDVLSVLQILTDEFSYRIDGNTVEIITYR